MSRKIGILGGIVVAGACVSFIYAGLVPKARGASDQDLRGQLIKLQTDNQQMSSALREKEAMLQDLHGAGDLRQALSAAQSAIAQMNTQLAQLAGEKRALQDANFSLNSRLDNTTKTLAQATEELRRARGQAVTLPGAPAQILAPSGALETKVKSLEAERDSLRRQLSGVAGATSQSGQSIKNLQDSIDKLNKELSQKKEQARALEIELKQARSAQDVSGPKEQARQIASLQDQNRRLAADISRLKSLQADSAQQAADAQAQVDQLQDRISALSRARADTTAVQDLKQQLSDAQDALAAKTSQVDQLEARLASPGRNKADTTAVQDLKQQLSDARSALASKTVQVDQLEGKLAVFNKNKVDVGDLRDLKQQLAEAKDALAAKTTQADDMFRALEATKRKLADREQEQRAIETKITQLESMTTSLQDELKKRKSAFDENDTLYNSMRQQVSQLSNVLAKKEIELENKAKELAALNEQSYGLKAKVEQLEAELNGARERQKKTLDDLYQAVKLNSALQERMIGASQSLSGSAQEPDQQKADQLKRKIEVILEPDKSQ